MSLVTHRVSAGSTASVLKPAVGQYKSSMTIQCLIVSASQPRREMLSRAAKEAGWDTVVCADAANAWSTVQRHRFEMALIDLEFAADAEAFKELTEHVSSSQQVLLVVCGREGNALEEIWARQLGAWLYLPGVAQKCDVRALCEEALPVVEKLTGKTLAAQS